MKRSRVQRTIVVGAVILGALVTLPPAQALQGGVQPPCVGRPGDAGDWTGMSGDLAAARYQPDEHVIDAENAGTLEPAWKARIGAGTGPGYGVMNSTPTVAHGCVFSASAGGDIVATDAGTGEKLWSRHFDAVTPGLGGTIVGAVVYADGAVVAFINETADGRPGLGPYAVSLDAKTGDVNWISEPFDTFPETYTNATPAVIPSVGGMVVFGGWSPPEGNSHGQGGFVLLDFETGALVKKTYTVPEADQADLDGDGVPDHAGGGIWSPPAYDEASGFAYIGAGNPFSKQAEHPHTNAILKIDLGDRRSATFGEIVDSYQGVPDQYREELVLLGETEVCDISDVEGGPWLFDDPACGQLDLDFGAPVNVTHIGGRTVVIGLQKAGIVWAFDGATGEPVWNTMVGGPCQPCNAGATAVSPDGVAGVSAPSGLAFHLDLTTGTLEWTSPIGDGTHFEGTTIANGVAYTIDNAGNLVGFDEGTGVEVLRRSVAIDIGSVALSLNSAGISVADNTLFVPVTDAAQTEGWVIAYRLPAA